MICGSSSLPHQTCAQRMVDALLPQAPQTRLQQCHAVVFLTTCLASSPRSAHELGDGADATRPEGRGGLAVRGGTTLPHLDHPPTDSPSLHFHCLFIASRWSQSSLPFQRPGRGWSGLRASCSRQSCDAVPCVGGKGVMHPSPSASSCIMWFFQCFVFVHICLQLVTQKSSESIRHNIRRQCLIKQGRAAGSNSG